MKGFHYLYLNHWHLPVPLRSIVNEHAYYFTLQDEANTASSILDIYDKKVDINSMAAEVKFYASEVAKREKYISNLLAIYEEVLIS